MNKADITMKKRHVRFWTQSGYAPAGVVELGDRELAGTNLVLRFGPERSGQWDGKSDFDVGTPAPAAD